MSTTSKVILGTLVGVAAGAALGLLFAPEKGSETRRKISERYTDLSDAIRNKIQDLVETVKNEYGGGTKSGGSDFGNQGGRSTASMKGEARDSFTA